MATSTIPELAALGFPTRKQAMLDLSGKLKKMSSVGVDRWWEAQCHAILDGGP